MTLGEGSCPEQQHRPHDTIGKCLPDPCRMAAKKTHLEPGRLLGLDPSGGEATKAGRDAVYRPALRNDVLHETVCRPHPVGNAWSHLGPRTTASDVNNVFNRKRPTVDRHHPHRFSRVAGRNTTGLLPCRPVDEIAAVRQKVRLIAASFGFGTVILVVVLGAIDIGEPDAPDLAEGAVLATTVFGVIGLLIALRWWSTAAERPRGAARLQLGFIIRVAFAEVGFLIGILGRIMTGSMTALVVGVALFLIALLLLVLAVGKTPDA